LDRNIVERLKEFMSISDLTNAALANILGYTSQEKISRLFRKESEGAKPSYDIIYDLSNSFDNLNIDWLITGNGSMFKNQMGNTHLNTHINTHFTDKNEALNEPKTIYSPRVITIDSTHKPNITLVPIEARTGYLTGYGDPEWIEQLEVYSVPGCTDGNYRMFEIEDESMYPTFLPGDYAVGRSVTDCYNIKTDTVYIIISHTEGIIIKRILNGSKTPDKLILGSDNPAFKPIETDCSSIAEMWEFYMLLTTLPGQQDPRIARLTKLEHEVEEIKRILKKK
jgi:phage repressor protein C with HTH and peptisase S24 domain